MIEPHNVHLFQRRGEPVQPPPVSGLLQRFPIVERVPPKLAGRAEIVRRHSRNHGRLAMLVEEKKIRIRPDVGRIAGNENRQVSDQMDTALVRLALEIAPLLEKQELSKPVPSSGFGQIATGIVHGRRFADANRLGPLQPARSAVDLFQGHKQAIIFQPGRLFIGEFCHSPVESAVSFRLEILPCPGQESFFPVDHPAKYDPVFAKRARRQIVWH